MIFPLSVTIHDWFWCLILFFYQHFSDANFKLFFNFRINFLSYFYFPSLFQIFFFFLFTILYFIFNYDQMKFCFLFLCFERIGVQYLNKKRNLVSITLNLCFSLVAVVTLSVILPVSISTSFPLSHSFFLYLSLSLFLSLSLSLSLSLMITHSHTFSHFYSQSLSLCLPLSFYIFFCPSTTPSH